MTAAGEWLLARTPVVLVLLPAVGFAMSLVHTYVPLERMRRLLAYCPAPLAHLPAAVLGASMPFCTCSAIPTLSAFLAGGVPLGVTFSFLVASSVVSEIGLVLLLGLFGWQLAATYVVAGLVVAVVVGISIDIFGSPTQVREHVLDDKLAEGVAPTPAARDRASYAWRATRELMRAVGGYLVVALVAGAALHAVVPDGALADVLGPQAVWAVPVGVLVGVPLWGPVGGVIPVVGVLLEKGVGVGTLVAFIIAVLALQPPDLATLKHAVKPRLFAVFLMASGLAIVGIGYALDRFLPVLT